MGYFGDTVAQSREDSLAAGLVPTSTNLISLSSVMIYHFPQPPSLCLSKLCCEILPPILCIFTVKGKMLGKVRDSPVWVAEILLVAPGRAKVRAEWEKE